ncbi:hypothetical protein FRC01_012680 [Tulasnella sp. 417]|nr:hypothetical protein FRC01_012680 [Tulasnella sp. 417]
MSHYRIDPVEIKRKDDAVLKKGAQGVVTVGTFRVSAKTKEFVSLLNSVVGQNGISRESLKNGISQLKEPMLSRFKEWPLEIRAALEMAGTPPETLKGWIPEINVAVKMLEWNRNGDEGSAKFFKSFVHELSLMAELSHPNIIQLVGFVEDMKNGNAWIVMPWEANGNVREFLQSGQWDLPERISLIQDTAKGLEYLHTRQPPICHGDLKSLNILVDFSYQAVITDFGSARIKQHVPPAERENASVRPQGAQLDDGISAEWTSPEVTFYPSTSDFTLTGPGYSLRWTAPEVIRGDDQDLPSDVWAIGWIAWEIVTGKMPFEELTIEGAIIHHTVMGKLPAIREDADLSHVLKLCSLMSDCWLLVPGNRIDASAFRRRVDIIVSTLMENDTFGAGLSTLLKPSVTPSGAESGSGGRKERSALLLLKLGQTCFLQGDSGSAMSYYQSAMDVATRTGDERAKGNALRMLGDGYRHASKHAEAEQAYMEARDIFSRYGWEDGTGNVLRGLGNIYLIQAKYNLAEKVLLDAYQMLSRSGDRLSAADALLDLAQIFEYNSKHREAEKAYMSSHGLHSRFGNDLGAANALKGLGEIYCAQSNYCEAEKVFLEAHEIYSSIGSRHSAAEALRGLGNTYREQSRFQEAEKVFNDTYKAHPPDSNGINAAGHFYDLGMLYHDQGRQNEAEACYRQALAFSGRVGDIDARVQTLLALGNLYHAQARYSHAEEATAEALAIGISLDNDRLQGRAHSLLAQIFASQSKCAQELESLIQAERSLAWIGPHEWHVATLVRLGTTHMEQDMYAEAEDYYRHAQSILSSMKDARGEGGVLSRLGVLYGRQDRYAEAEECFAQARVAYAMVADEEGEAGALDNLIAAYALQRKFDHAKVAYMEACESLSRTGQHARHANILRHLGNIHTEEGTYVEAEESYRHAQSIFLSMEDARGEAGVLFQLGVLYDRQDRHAKAEECFSPARVAFAMVADEDGQAKALDSLMRVYLLQGKFDDMKAVWMEGCKMYAQRGQPRSRTCAVIGIMVQYLEKSPLARDRCLQTLSILNLSRL